MTTSGTEDVISGGTRVALLTGGGDRPYALGLACSLATAGVNVDFIGSDELDDPMLRDLPRLRFLNLRGSTSPEASASAKVRRLAIYYLRLFRFAWASEARVFHILWNNKLEYFDRTLLMLYYRAWGRKIVHTVHNVNIRERDGDDNLLNRLTLRIQYRLCDHLFVHSEQMKQSIVAQYGVDAVDVSVIPFGLNETVPITSISGEEARRKLGLAHTDKVILFYGNIAPYKGLDDLLEAFRTVARGRPTATLVIAGRMKAPAEYSEAIRSAIDAVASEFRVVERLEYIPDDETEWYFKSADVLLLPYRHVFQSGVLSLSYSFGLPVIGTDVGTLAEDIVEGKTGLVARRGDPQDLAQRLNDFFDGDLYAQLPQLRPAIRRFSQDRYSWARVAALSCATYESLSR